MQKPEIYSDLHLQQICAVLAHSTTGLTGNEIGTHLLRLEIHDPGTGMPRPARLFGALSAHQGRTGCGSIVTAFIEAVMDPFRYSGMVRLFNFRRDELNLVLAERGLELRDDGKLEAAVALENAATAAARAARLEQLLVARGGHADVLACCRSDVINRGNFQVALAAARSVGDKLRGLSGLACDGHELVEKAFGGAGGRLPLVALTGLTSDAERSEHFSVAHLIDGMLSGMFGGTLGTFHNASAFAPRVSWPLAELDLVDLMTMASFIHRRLDLAVRVRHVAPAKSAPAPRRDHGSALA